MKHIPPAHSLLVAIAFSVGACEQTPSKGWRDDGAALPAPVEEAAAPAVAVATPQAAAPTDPANPRNYLTFTIKVTGMTCPFSCVREVREQLKAVPGVLHVEIDWDASRAIVDVQPGTDPATLVEGLKAPYAGRLLASDAAETRR